MGIASMILGILSLMISLTIFKDMSLILGVLAFVLGMIAIFRKKGRGFGIAGVILTVIAMVILFSGDSSDTSSLLKSEDDDTGVIEKTSGEKVSVEDGVLEIGDTWVVDGQWKLTIDSVTTTADRNQFADDNPAQVVIITYSYENLGYEDSLEIMDGLYFALDYETVVDGSGEVASSYPLGDVSPQEVPVGAKCSGAQACVGLKNASDKITITVKKTDGDGNSQSVKGELKVD